MKIGPHTLTAPLALAPMAGVTDLPFRRLCRSLGAGIAATEMVTADTRLWNTPKSRHRLDHRGEPEPRVVQIAGSDPAMMADAARANAGLGAQVIDINFGCPAKKVCNRAAGSALMRDERLVGRILAAVVAAALRQELDAPAAALGEARVHAEQVAREDRGLVAARGRADLEEDVPHGPMPEVCQEVVAVVGTGCEGLFGGILGARLVARVEPRQGGVFPMHAGQLRGGSGVLFKFFGPVARQPLFDHVEPRRDLRGLDVILALPLVERRQHAERGDVVGVGGELLLVALDGVVKLAALEEEVDQRTHPCRTR